MIVWFGIVIIAVAILSAVACAIAAARKITPNDYTMGATVIVALLLVVQVVIAIVAPFAGNQSEGDPIEFWMYLIVVFALPLGAGFWALLDRTRWANLVLAVVHLSIAVMTYRMMVIWG